MVQGEPRNCGDLGLVFLVPGEARLRRLWAKSLLGNDSVDVAADSNGRHLLLLILTFLLILLVFF